MKRDLDLIRQILLWIQDNSDGRRDITPSRIHIEGRTTQEIAMHMRWIQDEGLITYDGRKLKPGTRLIHCTRLTSKGCDVLAAMNNSTIWKKLLDKAESQTFGALCNIAISLAKEAVTAAWNHYQA